MKATEKPITINDVIKEPLKDALRNPQNIENRIKIYSAHLTQCMSHDEIFTYDTSDVFDMYIENVMQEFELNSDE